MNLVHTWRTAISERGDNKCTWSEAGACLVHLKESEKSVVN